MVALSRTCRGRVARPRRRRSTALRLPPVPPPSGARRVSPCTTRILRCRRRARRRRPAPSSSRGSGRGSPCSRTTSTRAARLDADDRRVGAHPAERHAGRLDQEADADADERPSARMPPLLAQLVVPDQSRPPARASRPRSSGRRPSARHRVRQLLVVERVAPAQLERVEPELRGASSRPSARARPSRSSTGRGRRRGPRVRVHRVPEPRTAGAGTGRGTPSPQSTVALAPAIRNAPQLSMNATFAASNVPSSSVAIVTVALVFACVLVGHQVLAAILDPLHRAARGDAASTTRPPPRRGSS